MNKIILIKHLTLLGILIACAGCLLTYTHRVSYSAQTNSSAANPGTDSTTVFVIAHLSKQPTSGVLPFVFLLKEKGLYGFSVSLFGGSKRVYQRGVIQAVAIATPAGTVFQSQDSTFVQYVPPAPDIGPLNPYHNQFSSFYQSPYVIALADSNSQVSLTLDYTLITRGGRREPHRLQQQLTVDRAKGFSPFSM